MTRSSPDQKGTTELDESKEEDIQSGESLGLVEEMHLAIDHRVSSESCLSKRKGACQMQCLNFNATLALGQDSGPESNARARPSNPEQFDPPQVRHTHQQIGPDLLAKPNRFALNIELM